MHGGVTSLCEYTLKACRGCNYTFTFFVNLGTNAYGRGLYWDMVPVFEHVTRAKSWICCSMLFSVLQTEQLNSCSLAECCIPSSVMTALFFMCCVQRHNLNVMLCI